jgi:hypothetical protein
MESSSTTQEPVCTCSQPKTGLKVFKMRSLDVRCPQHGIKALIDKRLGHITNKVHDDEQE